MTTRTSPIFVKTPQPDTEERLVLVPPGAVVREYESQAGPRFDLLGCVARDATPADLARAADADAHDQLARHYRETIGKLQAASARAEKAERELATERHEHGSTLTSRDMIHNKLAQAERERDEAKAGHNAVQPRVYALEADLAETVHERDALRAELARLTAPGEGSEGEPTDEELLATANAAWAANMSTAADARRALFRAGVAHKRARQQPAKDRATDEEFFEAYQRAFVLAADEEEASLRPIEEAARRVLAASGPDPSEVVRAALSWSEATAANGTARTVALQLACVAYRKAGGK